jgi:hypothetical protein
MACQHQNHAAARFPGTPPAAQAGIAAVVFDYRTFGGSDGEPRHWVSVTRHLQDYAAVIDHVQARGVGVEGWGWRDGGGGMGVEGGEVRGPALSGLPGCVGGRAGSEACEPAGRGCGPGGPGGAPEAGGAAFPALPWSAFAFSPQPTPRQTRARSPPTLAAASTAAASRCGE